jgi:hypothetical protein
LGQQISGKEVKKARALGRKREYNTKLTLICSLRQVTFKSTGFVLFENILLFIFYFLLFPLPLPSKI